jgi:hypothetical protein
MAELTIELSASLVSDAHQVWKVSPGKTYRFYRAVHDSKMAFLDIRGLDQLAGEPADWQDDAILKIIADDRWDREVLSRARGNQPRGREGITSEDRKRLTYFKELMFDAQVGDLIVVPADAYTKDVLIGELTTEAGDAEFVLAQDGEAAYQYLGRSVRWLTGVQKRFLSGDLIDKLHSPTAIFVLGKTLRHEIYRWAYGDFVFDGEYVGSFNVGKQKFTPEDSTVVSIWFSAFDVLRDALEHGTTGGLPASFESMGLQPLADGRAAELNININSPGAYVLRSSTPFALALIAMFALSGCDAKQVVNDHITVKMKVVGKAPKDCQHAIEASVNALAKALGKNRAEQMCKLGQRASKDAKMSVGARLKP